MNSFSNLSGSNIREKVNIIRGINSELVLQDGNICMNISTDLSREVYIKPSRVICSLVDWNKEMEDSKYSLTLYRYKHCLSALSSLNREVSAELEDCKRKGISTQIVEAQSDLALGEPLIFTSDELMWDIIRFLENNR